MFRKFNLTTWRLGVKNVTLSFLYLFLLMFCAWILMVVIRFTLPFKIIDRNTKYVISKNLKFINMEYVNNPFEFNFKPNVLSDNWRFEITNVKSYKTVDFLARTNTKVIDLDISLNGMKLMPNDFKEDSRIEKTGYNYYYFNHTFPFPSTQLVFSSSNKDEILIKEVINK